MLTPRRVVAEDRVRVGDPLEPRHGAGVSRVRVGMVRLRRAQERVLDVLSLRVVRHVERAIVVEPRARRAELPPVLAPPRRVRGAGSSRACRDHAGERSCSMQHGLACSRRWARSARELATARTARQRSNQYLLQLMRKNALDACSFQNDGDDVQDAPPRRNMDGSSRTEESNKNETN